MLDTKIKPDPSMEEILQTIRKVVSQDMLEENKQESPEIEDVLELTQEIQEDGSIKEIESVADDVIQEIDAAISGEEKDSPVYEESFEEQVETVEIAKETAELDQVDEEGEIKSETSESHEPVKELVSENNDSNDIEEESEKNSDNSEDVLSKQEQNSLETENITQPNNVNDKQDSRLISDNVVEASKAAIKGLIKTAEKPTSDGLSFRSGTTVEELLVEAIRPQLSQWLDKNLASIVQNIVEKEIKHLLPKDDE